MKITIDVPDEIAPNKINSMSVRHRALLLDAYGKGITMHDHCHPINVPGDLPNDKDPEVKEFYADDQKLLDSIPKTSFEPVKPGTYERNPMWPPIEWAWFFYRLWNNHMKYWPHQLRDGISNVCSWFTMIWNLRDWDNFHLYSMMLKQMQGMQVGCRANSAEAPHHAALDRCVVILEEIIKRGQCDCDALTGITYKEPEEKTAVRRARCMKCYVEQKAMLEEFGQLFAAFSRNWWD